MRVTQQVLSEVALKLENCGTQTPINPIDPSVLACISQKTRILDWLTFDLFDSILSWFFDQLDFFQRILDQLDGDGGGIARIEENLNRCVGSIEQAESTLARVAEVALTDWQGEAATQFNKTMGFNIRLLCGYKTATGVLATQQKLLAETLMVAKEAVIELAKDAVSVIVECIACFGIFGGRGVGWAIRMVGQYCNDAYEVMNSCIEHATSIIGRIGHIGETYEKVAYQLETGNNLEAISTSAKVGTFGHEIKGTEPQLADAEICEMLTHFNDDSWQSENAFRHITDEELFRLGIDPKMLNAENTGFTAKIFVSPEGKYVVGFAGTDFSDMNDVVEDVVGGITVSPQTENVLALVEQIERSGIGDNVVYAGHSLGGRLAAIAAIESGNGAVIFNAAGVSDATLSFHAGRNGVAVDELRRNLADGQVRSYRNSCDPLYMLQEHHWFTEKLMPDAVGHQISLFETSPTNSNDWTYPHSLESIQDSLKELVNR